MADLSSFDTEQSLIDSLSGEFNGNDKTKTGSAYHKILEGEYEVMNNLVSVKADGLHFAFTMEQAIHGMNYHAEHDKMVHEMSIQKIYDTRFGPIQVGGRIDGIEGVIIRDAKTKYKAVTATEYMDSCQWKFYLDILEVDQFYFDVFEFKGFDSLPDQSPIILNGVDVIPYEPIPCLRYAAMQTDVAKLLNDFLEYIDNRNFWHYLKPATTELPLTF